MDSRISAKFMLFFLKLIFKDPSHEKKKNLLEPGESDWLCCPWMEAPLKPIYVLIKSNNHHSDQWKKLFYQNESDQIFLF